VSGDEGATPDPAGFDAEPASAARLSLAVGLGAAAVAFAAVAAYSWLAAAAAGLGAGALGVGGVRDRRPLVRVGAGVLAASTVLAGVEGAPPLAVGVGAWAALVAWDATTYGLDVAGQAGGGAARDVQARRAGASALVGVAGLAVGAGGFLAGTSGAAALAGAAGVAAVALVLALALD